MVAQPATLLQHDFSAYIELALTLAVGMLWQSQSQQ